MSEWEPLASPPSLQLCRREGAVRVCFDRPDRLNAFDSTMSASFLAVLDQLSSDRSVGCVLLTGAGKAFASGADVAASLGRLSPEAIEQRLRSEGNAIIELLRQMPKPVVAAVNGPAAGMGCSFAIACDLVVAASSSYFLLSFANLALSLDGGASLLLPARVGLGRALTLAMLAERLPAADALTWGLADRVVADADLTAVAGDLAVRLAAGPTGAYAATKALLNQAVLGGLSAQLDREATTQRQLLESEEFAAAVAAFVAKR